MVRISSTLSPRRPQQRQSAWLSGIGIAILLVLLVGTLIAIAKIKPAEEQKGPFTTNIDRVHKIINSSAADTEDTEGREDYSATLWNAYELSGMRAATLQAVENVVSPGTKVVVLHPGMRKEEVANLFAKKLSWDEKAKQAFAALTPETPEDQTEGYFYPDTYFIAASTTPEKVHDAVVGRFQSEVGSRYTPATAKVIDVNLALTIASIIQREAAGKQDMGIISGIIWNRLFKDMSLDMDATLQYAKGNEKIGWWPRVLSKDKFIESPYNTYKYGGLPPTPISSPSLAAINAALNPKKTDALFYVHDTKRRIHTARTYKEHKVNIARYY